MKLRVVGWVTYCAQIEAGEVTWAVRNAIIDEIKKHGYKFSGSSHQDNSYCTPVLNNGKMYRFSTRGWGGLMAEAYGYTGCMDYTMFDLPMHYKNEICPDDKLNEFDYNIFEDDEDGFDYGFEDDEEFKEYLKSTRRPLIAETDLNERFEVNVTKDVLDFAQCERKVKLQIYPELRYLGAGDTLALTCDGITEEFTVADVLRKKDFEQEKLQQVMLEIYSGNIETSKRAEKEYNDRNMILSVTLK